MFLDESNFFTVLKASKIRCYNLYFPVFNCFTDKSFLILVCHLAKFYPISKSVQRATAFYFTNSLSINYQCVTMICFNLVRGWRKKMRNMMSTYKRKRERESWRQLSSLCYRSHIFLGFHCSSFDSSKSDKISSACSRDLLWQFRTDKRKNVTQNICIYSEKSMRKKGYIEMNSS